MIAFIVIMILLIINDKLRPFITSPIGALDGPVPFVASRGERGERGERGGRKWCCYGDIWWLNGDWTRDVWLKKNHFYYFHLYGDIWWLNGWTIKNNEKFSQRWWVWSRIPHADFSPTEMIVVRSSLGSREAAQSAWSPLRGCPLLDGRPRSIWMVPPTKGRFQAGEF